jgi:hypothetical protein
MKVVVTVVAVAMNAEVAVVMTAVDVAVAVDAVVTVADNF